MILKWKFFDGKVDDGSEDSGLVDMFESTSAVIGTICSVWQSLDLGITARHFAER